MNLVKYRNAVVALRSQGRGDSIGESVYFNFEDGYLYFNLDTFKARLRFSYSMEEGDTYENRYVDTDKLLTIVNNFPSLKLDCSTYTFTNPDDERESFRIPTFEEVCDLPSLFDIEGWDSFDLTPESIAYLPDALQFSGKEWNEGYDGVMFIKNHLIATTKGATEGYYEADLDEEFLSPLKLHDSIVSIMIRLDTGMGAKIFSNNKKTLVSIMDRDLEILSSKEVSMEGFPDPDEIRSQYDHENYVIVPRREVIEMLNFMLPFVKGTSNSRVLIKVSDDGTEFITETHDINDARRYVKLTDCSGAEGFEAWVQLPRLRTALSIFESDFVNLQVDNDAVTICISASSEEEGEDETKRAVILKMLEE